MSVTTDRDDPALQQILANGQQAAYLVLSEDERAKGYVLPVRREYRHTACGTKTTMPTACAETYARDPKFYTGTFCCACNKHFPLSTEDGEPAFLWWPDGDPVGADAEEAQAYLAKRRAEQENMRVRELEHRRLCAIANLDVIKSHERADSAYRQRRVDLGLPDKGMFDWSAQQIADMEAIKAGRPLQ